MNREWAWITICVPPDSDGVQVFTDLFQKMGFRFDPVRIGLVHENGTFIDYAPGPPPAGA